MVNEHKQTKKRSARLGTRVKYPKSTKKTPSKPKHGGVIIDPKTGEILNRKKLADANKGKNKKAPPKKAEVQAPIISSNVEPILQPEAQPILPSGNNLRIADKNNTTGVGDYVAPAAVAIAGVAVGARLLRNIGRFLSPAKKQDPLLPTNIKSKKDKKR